MTHNIIEGADRSSLKLTLQIKDSQYLIKGSSISPDTEGSDIESLDDSGSTMTDTTNDTSLLEPAPENGHELISNPSSNVIQDIQGFNSNDVDPANNATNDVALPTENHHVKSVNSNNGEETADPPVVIKKENGSAEPEDDVNNKNKADPRSDEERKSPENGEDHNKDSDEDDDISDLHTVAADSPPPPTQPLISVRKTEDLMMSRTQVNGSNEECSVCCERFNSPNALEQHKATRGHYTCDDCPKSVFSSPTELGQHQAMHHQPPVQQLAQQVQRIPAAFTSPSYRAPTPPQQRNVYMPSPPLVPYYHSQMMQQQQEASGLQQIGSGVVLSTVPSPQQQQQQQSVPTLPPGIQLSKRPANHQQSNQHDSGSSSSPKQARRDDDSRSGGIRLPDSITLVSRTPPQPRRDSVTDMLANRGITVVPSTPPQNTSSIPRSLMNTGAISITPSSQKSQQHQPQHRAQTNFAVPAPKPVSRLLTVDLTKESDAPPRRSLARGGRMRGPTGRVICQICDKAFPTQQELQQHMACHRGGGTPNKLAYECRECTAQYPTEAGLQAHRQKYHGAGGPSPDMAIPVVDLKQVGVMSRLAALGIRSVIPLSQLHSGSGGGLFGLPVVAVDSASNPAICNIGGLGASNLLPLGPLKNLSFNNNNMR